MSTRQTRFLLWPVSDGRRREAFLQRWQLLGSRHFREGNTRGKDSRVGTSPLCSNMTEHISLPSWMRRAQGDTAGAWCRSHTQTRTRVWETVSWEGFPSGGEWCANAYCQWLLWLLWRQGIYTDVQRCVWLWLCASVRAEKRQWETTIWLPVLGVLVLKNYLVEMEMAVESNRMGVEREELRSEHVSGSGNQSVHRASQVVHW